MIFLTNQGRTYSNYEANAWKLMTNTLMYLTTNLMMNSMMHLTTSSMTEFSGEPTVITSLLMRPAADLMTKLMMQLTKNGMMDLMTSLLVNLTTSLIESTDESGSAWYSTTTF